MRNVPFNHWAKDKFKFLLDEYGFEISIDEQYKVQYLNEYMAILIRHHRYSYEISLTAIMNIDGKKRLFPLPCILHGLLGKTHQERSFYQAVDEKDIVFCLENISRLVKNYFPPLIRFDKDAISSIEEARFEIVKETVYQLAVVPVKGRALEAWRNKEYNKVVSLYESIQEHLSDTEAKRLLYARKIIEN